MGPRDAESRIFGPPDGRKSFGSPLSLDEACDDILGFMVEGQEIGTC